jgi:hypothetical protein
MFNVSHRSWGAYLNVWNKKYPNLKVSRPAEDICGYCYKFYNHFWLGKRTTTTTLGGGGTPAGGVLADCLSLQEIGSSNELFPASCLPTSSSSSLLVCYHPLPASNTTTTEEEPDDTIPLDGLSRPTDHSEAEILRAAEHVQSDGRSTMKTSQRKDGKVKKRCI